MIYDIAEIEDIPLLINLYGELTEVINQLEPFFFKKDKQTYSFFENMILSADSDILVARTKDEVVGFGIIQMQKTLPYPIFEQHVFCYCLDLIVTKEQRDKGIGSQLLNNIEEWAYKRGAEYIELSVLNKNKKAHKVYQSSGFSEKITTLYKKINKN